MMPSGCPQLLAPRACQALAWEMVRLTSDLETATATRLFHQSTRMVLLAAPMVRLLAASQRGVRAVPYLRLPDTEPTARQDNDELARRPRPWGRSLPEA